MYVLYCEASSLKQCEIRLLYFEGNFDMNIIFITLYGQQQL